MRPSLQLFLVIIFGLVVGYSNADNLTDNPCQDVRLAGFVCLNCTTLGYCIHDASGQWQTVSMLGCQSEHNFYCSDEGTFGCTWQSKCLVPTRGPFSCQQPGLFPDPYDCRKYHECSDLNVDTPRQCNNGAGYSTLVGNCALPRDSEQCTEPQFECQRSGQIGGWPADNRFFYICMNDTPTSLYPLMMKCREGYTFEKNGCVLSTRINEIEKSPQCLDNYIYECPTRTPGNEYCKCIDGELQRKTCPIGYDFDAKLLTCVTGRMYDCRDFEVQKCPNSSVQDEYCLCIDRQFQVQRCPQGEVFNENAMICLNAEQDFEINDVHEKMYRVFNL